MGIINNNHVSRYAQKYFDELVKMTAKGVRMYNTEKPLISLGKMNPVELENKKSCFREKDQ